MPFCPDCGIQVSEDTRFCPECGRPLAIGQAVKGKSKKKLAGIIVACTIAIIVIVVIATRPPTTLLTYTLSVSVSPSGAGSVSPSSGEYESGVQVTLTASPASGYTFDYWSGSASGTTSTITIIMDSDKSLTAHFETIPTAPEVLFSDDFSDESSGWVTYDEYDGRVAYHDGCLYVKDYAAYEGAIHGDCQRYFTDFILEIETWLVSGTDNNWHLVECRLQDEENYYDFGISADGYYDILKVVNRNRTVLVSPTYSSYIHQGQGVTNLIHIECIGSSLSLSVNGHLLEEVTDATFSGGDITLAANALAGTFTEVAFDNIVVSAPFETTPPQTPVEPEPAIPAHFTTYTDELGLFSISYPPEWEPALEYMEEIEQVSEDIISSITSDLPMEEASFLFMAGLPTMIGFDPNVNIVVEPLPGIMWTHDEVVTAEIEGLKAVVSDYQEFSRVKTTIDNRTATIIEWQGNVAGFGTCHDAQMIFIVSKTVWVVTCTASPDDYSEWEDDFDAIVRSLRILQ